MNLNYHECFSNRKNRILFSAFMIAVLMIGFASLRTIGGSGFGAVSSSNPCQAGWTYVGTDAVGTAECARLTVQIVHQEQTVADPKLIAEGYIPSCLISCHGIVYTLDPTVLITNSGHDFEQCKVFGKAGTITCTAADVATVIGLSSSATVPAATDTFSSGPCSSTNEITTSGLTDVAGTVTAGAAGTTVTTSITNTFTASATVSNVQVACLQTEVNTGTNVIVYAEGTFGPDSLASGNTLQITWQISRT
jgi:hypothetical protein